MEHYAEHNKYGKITCSWAQRRFERGELIKVVNSDGKKVGYIDPEEILKITAEILAKHKTNKA